MNVSTGSMPHLVDDAPSRVAWFAISSIILRLVCWKEKLVLEEVDVAVDVGHHQLLVHVHVGLEQIRVRGIVVDHHLVDLRETRTRIPWRACSYSMPNRQCG